SFSILISNPDLINFEAISGMIATLFSPGIISLGTAMIKIKTSSEIDQLFIVKITGFKRKTKVKYYNCEGVLNFKLNSAPILLLLHSKQYMQNLFFLF